MIASRIFNGSLRTSAQLISLRYLKQVKPNVEVPNMIDRAKYRLGFGDLQYSVMQLNAAGENMFAVCAEYPVFEEFVDKLSLPDTFQSWFSVTALHMWMCLVRLRREGTEGQLLKRAFVNVSLCYIELGSLKLLWLDLRSRMRTFKILRKQHKQVKAFQMQFFGSMFAYDEGLLSHSDALLATALWRNLFLSSDTTTGQELEIIVEYVRKNLAHLDGQSSSTILGFGTPTFLPLIGNELNAHFANERLRYCLSWPEFMK
ncbi:Ubiquinol-cytochrome c reductase complex chaperone [Fasciolopsis buskii]|uniref:Ubiquinol-cytochrome c reductase complex chaperone n=1 Tax=Fasciolopsis buskii TaxID=27845 RepID=A0A8E0VNA1_9TREM|nr:Ubiquinol-cytochrome c reductase complex chaperone [Fasciolopsis buski]